MESTRRARSYERDIPTQRDNEVKLVKIVRNALRAAIAADSIGINEHDGYNASGPGSIFREFPLTTSSFATQIAPLSNLILFKGRDTSGNYGLWVTDGTAEGTQELVSIDSYYTLHDSDLTAFNGRILFNAPSAGLEGTTSYGLWISDGTIAGTYELTGIVGVSSSGLYPSDMTVFNGKVLFSGFGINDPYGNYGLWVTDGTAAGTYELPRFTGLDPSDLTVFNDKVLFAGYSTSGYYNYTLWVTDGTAAGTYELTNIAGADPYGLRPHDMTVFAGKVLFIGVGTNDDLGGGLWVTNGIAAGTYELTGIAGSASIGIEPSDMTVFNGKVFFAGLDANNYYNLWVTDGTTAGTHEVTGVSTGHGLQPSDMTVFEDKVYFRGLETSGVWGLWVTDGTAAGTHELTDVVSPVTDMIVFNGQLFFGGQGIYQSYGYWNLWVTDGTASGTHQLADVTNANIFGLDPSNFTVLGSLNVNLPPVIDTAQSVLTGLLSEHVGLTGSPSLDYANGGGPPSGVIAFSDPDTGDRPNATPPTLDQMTVTYTDANGVDDTSQLGSDLILELKSGFSILQPSNNTNTGKIDWTYAIPDNELDFLGIGETLIVTAPVQIDDGHGGTVTQSVVITMNGANDAPVARPDSAAVQKGWTLVADAAHGVLANDSDPDIHDWLSVTAINGITDDVDNPFGVTGKYGTLWVNSNGSYRYAANPTLGSATKFGSAQDKFTYTISDGHSSFVTSTLIVTVTAQVSIPTAETYYVWEGARSDDPNSGGHSPPDNALAAGAGMLVSAENDEILLSDLQGRKPAPEPLGKFFFSKLTPDFSNYVLSDPTAAYDPDPNSPKFVVSLDEVATDPLTQLHSASHTLLAASTTPTPTLGASKWTFNSIDTSYILQGQATFADQPRFAVDGSYIYMTTDQTPSGTPHPTISELTVLSKSSLAFLKHFDLGGLPYLGTAPSYQPTIDPQGGCFYVGHGMLFKGTYDRDYLSIAHSTGTTAPALANPVYLGPIDSGTPNYIIYDPNASKIDGSDGRITSAVVAGDFLYTVFEVQPFKVSPPAVEWVKIDITDPTHPSNVETGYIDGSSISQGSATYNGSIAVDRNGDVLINFNASGPDLPIGDYFVVHHNGDPDTKFSTPVAYTPGDSYGSYSGGALPGDLARWGDYSTAISDPNHLNGFYISNEYSTGLTTWSTASAEVLLPQQPSGGNTILFA